MTSATTTPARGVGGRRAEGYGLILFAVVLNPVGTTVT